MSELEKDLIVTLRCFIGKVTYNEKGEISSKNAPVKLRYGKLEWVNFMKSAKNQYSKLVVEGAKEETISFKDGKDFSEKPIKIRQSDYKKVDIPESIVAEVEEAMGKIVEELTDDQKRIATLEAQIAALSGGGKATKEGKEPKAKKEGEGFDNTAKINEELEAARKKYHEVLGKKPNHMKKLATLISEIEAEQNK